MGSTVFAGAIVVVIVAAVAFLLILTISLVLAWLSSRGQFMFLHCVAQNKGEVAVPWKRYAQQANSLFLFKLLIGFAGTIAVIICLIPLGVIGFSFAKTGMAGFAMMNVVTSFFVDSTIRAAQESRNKKMGQRLWDTFKHEDGDPLASITKEEFDASF